MNPPILRANIRRRPLPRPITSSVTGLAAGWLLLGHPLAATAFSSTSRTLPSTVAAASRSAHRNSISRVHLPPSVAFATSYPFVSVRTKPSNFRLMSSMSSSDAAGALPTKWSDVLSSDPNSIQWKHASNLFPPLTPSSHKGSHGRIAIFGGSEKYTGAPYYAAQSALHCGVDLATIFCAKEAAVPIKCYSPELMVQGVYSVEELDSLVKEGEGLLEELEQCKQSNDVMTNEVHEVELIQTMEKLEHSEEKQHLLIRSELEKSELEKDVKMEALAERLSKMKSIEERLQSLRDREEEEIGGVVEAISAMLPSLHALCIGPGLGRHPLVFKAVEKVIHKAIESNLMLVLDADALFMLSLEEYRSLLEKLRAYERCVMTPNLMEMRRLNDALPGGSANGGHANIVVQKGGPDMITNDCHTMQCEEEGGLKRSGGIGDVLAGTISAFMAWNAILEKGTSEDRIESQKQRAFATWTACCAVKRATKISYQRKRRAMSALDVCGEVGEVLAGMEGGLQLEVCGQMDPPERSLQE